MVIGSLVPERYSRIQKNNTATQRTCAQDPLTVAQCRCNTILRKCLFFTDTIGYLGHVILLKHLEHASHTMDAIRELQLPTNLTKRRSLLGLCNEFRWLVPKYCNNRGSAYLVFKEKIIFQPFPYLILTSFMRWNRSSTRWYLISSWRCLTLVDIWSFTQKRETSKLAVFYYK